MLGENELEIDKKNAFQGLATTLPSRKTRGFGVPAMEKLFLAKILIKQRIGVTVSMNAREQITEKQQKK